MKESPAGRQIALALLFLAAAAAGADEPETPASVTGYVLNGTSSDNPMPDQEVWLLALGKDGNEVSRTAGRTTSRGQFQFSVPPEAVAGYRIFTTYQGVDYTSKTLMPARGGPVGVLLLKVYETGADTTLLMMDDYHLVVDAAEKGIAVRELFAIRTTGARTYEASSAGPLRFPLPAGATDVAYFRRLASDEVRLEDGNFVLTAPVSPEGLEVDFRYHLAAAGSSVSLARELSAPVASFHLFVSVPRVTVAAPLLSETEPLKADELQYRHFAAGRLEPGARVEISLGGLPAWRPNVALAFTLLGTLLVIAAALVLPWLRNRDGAPVHAAHTAGHTLREQLVDQMARLDESYHREQLEPEEYRMRRAEVRQQLGGLLRAERSQVREQSPSARPAPGDSEGPSPAEPETRNPGKQGRV